MNILITGGCGFLGSNVAASYLQEGSRVTIIDRMLKRGCWENFHWLEGMGCRPGCLELVQTDIAEIDSIEDVFSRRGPFDYVCHFAGQVAMTFSMKDPIADFRTNALGTMNLLEVSRRKSPDCFFAFSSTNKVYGDLKHLRYGETDTRYCLLDYPKGIDESMPVDFASPYGCSKGCADQYVKDWYRNFGLETVVFRHSSIYGQRQYATEDQGWVGWSTTQAIQQQRCRLEGSSVQPFSISGSGKQVRDLLDSRDLVALYRLAFLRRQQCAGEVFNIGGGIRNSVSMLELFQMLEDLLGMNQGLVFDKLPRRQSDQDFFVADIDKAERVLGWSPSIGVLEGLTQMIQWVQGI